MITCIFKRVKHFLFGRLQFHVMSTLRQTLTEPVPHARLERLEAVLASDWSTYGNSTRTTKGQRHTQELNSYVANSKVNRSSLAQPLNSHAYETSLLHEVRI